MREDKLKKHGLSKREFVEILSQYTRDIGQFGREQVVPRLSARGNTLDAQGAMSATFYRAQLWLESVADAVRPDQFQAAATGARSLFEHLLDMKKLNAEPHFAQAYFDFATVKRFDIARNLMAFLDANPGIDRGMYQAEVLLAKDLQKQSERHAFCVRNKWSNKQGQPAKRVDHWWGNSVGERAKELGIVYEERFWHSYSLLSQYIHPGGAGVDRLSYEAFVAFMGIVHRMSQEIFVEAIDVACRFADLFSKDEQFKAEFERVRNFRMMTATKLAMRQSKGENR